jgi:DNA-binding transcriptional LysR family regulator
LPSLAATVVPPIVKSFAEASPGIAVSISDGLADEIVELVSTGRADLGLTAQATDAGDLAETPWVSDLLVALVAVGHPLAGESAVRWSDLVSFPFIGLTEGSSVRQLTDAGFAHTGVLPRYAHVVRSPMVVHGMVASGLGVAALPGFLAQLAPEALTVAVPIEEPTLRRQIVVATSSRHPRPRAVALFIRHLLEHTQ